MPDDGFTDLTEKFVAFIEMLLLALARQNPGVRLMAWPVRRWLERSKDEFRQIAELARAKQAEAKQAEAKQAEAKQAEAKQAEARREEARREEARREEARRDATRPPEQPPPEQPVRHRQPPPRPTATQAWLIRQPADPPNLPAPRRAGLPRPRPPPRRLTRPATCRSQPQEKKRRKSPALPLAHIVPI